MDGKKTTYIPMIPTVAKFTISSCSFSSTNAIASNAKPLRQFDMIKVFLRPQYFSNSIQTSVPVFIYNEFVI